MLDVMTKDEASKRLKDGCVRFYTLRKAGEELVIKCVFVLAAFWAARVGADEGSRKGTPPVVRIAMKSVGKRMVTLLSGYEAWDLSGEELAADLKLAAASATASAFLPPRSVWRSLMRWAVQLMAGCSPKKPIYEIMVQGALVSFVRRRREGADGWAQVRTRRW